MVRLEIYKLLRVFYVKKIDYNNNNITKQIYALHPFSYVQQ